MSESKYHHSPGTPCPKVTNIQIASWPMPIIYAECGLNHSAHGATKSYVTTC